MINSIRTNIRNRINHFFLKNEEDLFKEFPVFNEFKKINIESEKILKPYYSDYIQNVSSEAMAISLELASCLYTFCMLNKPKTLLDLGSGFSSFVFRLYSKNTGNNCKIYSVDDDKSWIFKTKNYLEKNGVSTENIYVLEDFLKLKVEKFDMILHDLNYVEIRKDYLEMVIDQAWAGGFIFFDDVHKSDYYSQVVKCLKRHQLNYFGLKKITGDKFNRFSIFANKIK